MDWIGLAEERDTCGALVKMVVNFCISQNAGNLGTN